MSNTQHSSPKAAMNGARRPSQMDVLMSIAGATQALAQHATALPMPQRFHCAVDMAQMKAWELRHQEHLQSIVAQFQQRQAQFQAMMGNPEVDEPTKLTMMNNAPNLQAMCAAYGEQAGDPMPTVNEANTIATLPGIGTAFVCAGCLPPGEMADPMKKQLLIAQGPLSAGMVAQVRGS